MNFKVLFFISIIFVCSSCGVKGPPKAPKGTEVPSFVSPYLKDGKLNKTQIKKKESNNQEEVDD
ncbi:hypothetical protein [Halobacteriovorax sp. HLS]|uniref:hypothetical protein n=1 Tax=Halobacteriovorax sp. HLS TaxID=2234000 RepID=UPI000FD86F17|nr:hypothetical protein [Halobacteriovorax sp. HLS]